MEIKVGFEITYAAVAADADGDHAHRFIPRAVPTSSAPRPSSPSPTVPIGFYRDSFGNICGRLVAPAGGVTLARPCAGARFRIARRRRRRTPQQLPIDQLPDDVLLYLMASRYCETDKLTDIAWSLFGNTQRRAGRGCRRSATSCTTTSPSAIEHAHHMKSAHDVYEQRTGVCRDFRPSGADLVPLHGHSGALLHRLSGRHRHSARARADGFFRLVRGLSVRPVVHLRRAPQCTRGSAAS